MTHIYNLGILASGAGTNFSRIVEAVKTGNIPNATVTCLITDRDATVLDKAKSLQIPNYQLSPTDSPNPQAWFNAVLEKLKLQKVSLVILAGFLRKIEDPLLTAYKDRILNIHPALLPKYGGTGMYGSRVHEAVLKNKEKETGVTVHVVDAAYDHGPIVLQETIAVLAKDTAETLARRVHELEYEVYPKAIALYLKQIGYE